MIMKRRDFLQYSLAGGLLLAHPHLAFATSKVQSIYNPTRYIFVTDTESPFITVFDVISGEQLGLLNFDLIPEIIEISRDDSKMVVGNRQVAKLVLSDLVTHQRQEFVLPSPPHQAHFVPRSKELLVAMSDQVGVINYESGELTLYAQNSDAADGTMSQQSKFLYSSFTENNWLLDSQKPFLYKKSVADAIDAPWETIDLSSRVQSGTGFKEGIISPENYLLAFTSDKGNEGFVYFPGEDKLISTGHLGGASTVDSRMVEPYMDSLFMRVLFADNSGNITLFKFLDGDELQHFHVDFSPRMFRSGWLDTTWILGGDRALLFQSYDDPDDRVTYELPGEVLDMWVSGDSKILYLTVDHGEPQVLRYDIRRRQALEAIPVHGVIQSAKLRMGSNNSVCY